MNCIRSVILWVLLAAPVVAQSTAGKTSVFDALGNPVLTDVATQAELDAAVLSGGGVTLTDTYIGYGSGSNTVTGETAFTYDSVNNVMKVGAVSFGGVASINANGSGIFTLYNGFNNESINLNFGVGGANTVFLTSDTGINLFDFGTVDAKVPYAVYDATGWDANLTVPTKDAVRDVLETKVSTSGAVIGTRLAAYSGTSGTLLLDSGWSPTTLRDRANHTGTQALSTLAQGGATTGQVVAWNGTGWAPANAGTTIADLDYGDITVTGTGATWTIDTDAVALGADTTGNYVATIADSGASEITVANSGTENAAVTLAIAGSIARDDEVAAAYQPKDEDLTSIAGVTTTAFGRGLLASANASALRTTAGVVIGTDVQAYNADLSDLADGSLSGSKVGTGINASNITAGTLGTAYYTRAGVRRTVYVNAGAMIQVTSSTAPEAVPTRGTHLAYDALAFDSATDEAAGFWWTPPSTYNAGTVTVKTHWTCAAGSAGDDVEFEVSAVAVGDDGVIDTAPGTAVAVLDEVLAAADMHISATSAAITIGGTPAANKPTYFKIKRDAQIAGDLASDARLLGVTIEFTESATEPAAQ